jgi:hypothetical protein
MILKVAIDKKPRILQQFAKKISFSNFFIYLLALQYHNRYIKIFISNLFSM